MVVTCPIGHGHYTYRFDHRMALRLVRQHAPYDVVEDSNNGKMSRLDVYYLYPGRNTDSAGIKGLDISFTAAFVHLLFNLLTRYKTQLID